MTKQTNEKLKSLNKQIKLQENMQKRGFNVVMCCHCGSVLLTTIKKKKTLCWSCEETVHFEDCEDLYWNSMPEQTDLMNIQIAPKGINHDKTN